MPKKYPLQGIKRRQENSLFKSLLSSLAENVPTNCWEYVQCNFGPGSQHPCPVVKNKTSNGVNRGKNAGRICWTVPNTPCFIDPTHKYTVKREYCLSCDFFSLVRDEEGDNFKLLKLAQGVNTSIELHTKISQMEHLLEIQSRIHSNFDLFTTLSDITDAARKVTGAKKSIVFLLNGDPPGLHGQFKLKGKENHVVINIDDTSAVGYAAAHKSVVNLRDIQSKSSKKGTPDFNNSFDVQCDCSTDSLLAVPAIDSEKRVTGVITVVNAVKGFFSADDEWFMRTFAMEVALALEKQKFLQQSVSALRLASIGETVAGLSHCIKNIAHALRGSSYIIKRAIDSNNVRDVKAAWEILDRHIENLAKLSLDVLTYEPSSNESGKKFKLNEMVTHVTELYREEARARAVTILTDLEKNVDPVAIDARGIYRCLVNLITNALDACPLSEGVVTVSTKRTGAKELLLVVSDNGRGMDENTRLELFEAFKTTKPGFGSGLGLPTVADIVNKHNGKIEVDTVHGKGTSFKLHLQEFS
jgi:signal transduction histidine kinase